MFVVVVVVVVVIVVNEPYINSAMLLPSLANTPI